MKLKLSKKKWVIIVAIVATSTLAYCANLNLFESDMSGTVFDASIGKPMEGAYVIAVYNESGSVPFGHAAHWCVKTKGMYTGKDGTYRFALEGFHRNALDVHAIKLDYYVVDFTLDKQRDFYLKPQDPAKPKYSSYIHCERPKTREDVTANIEYLKLVLAEHIQFGARQADLLNMIQRLESTPEKAQPSSK